MAVRRHRGDSSTTSSAVLPSDVVRHRVIEGMLSLSGIGALIAGMAAIDETFRGHAVALLSRDPSNALAVAKVQVDRVASQILETAGYGYEQASLTLFFLGAAALVWLMLRT